MMPDLLSPSRLPQSKNALYLIDISSFIFRAFFAIRSLKTSQGEPTNAVYGVATMLARIAEEAKPDYLAVVYDSREPSFRKEIYSEYKANRSEAPEDLLPQFSRIEELIQGFEIHSYRQSGIEADDLIATLTQRWCELDEQNQVVIVSSDKDLMQLVGAQVVLWDTMSDQIYGPLEVEKKFRVKPHQMRDYLALMGDSSDNIPGVPGIGPKTASDLLIEHGSLEKILAAAKEGKIQGRKGEALQKHESDALLSAQLATVRQDLELEIPLSNLQYHFHLNQAGIRLLKDLDFSSLLIRWQKQLGQSGKKPEFDLSSGLSLPEAGLAPGTGTASALDERFRTIYTQKQFEELLEQLEKVGEFGIDLETTSLNPREAALVGVAVCYDLSFGVYIPLGHLESPHPQLPKDYVLSRLKPILENDQIKKIGQNLKYDWSVFQENGIFPKGITSDTMVAAYLLDPDGRHNLQTLALKYLEYEVQTFEQVCGKGKDQITFDRVSVPQATRYSAEEAWVALKLWFQLKPRLEAENLMQVFNDLELPLVEILVTIERQGVCLDRDWLKQLSEKFALELQQIEERVQAYAQAPINLNSPKQLAVLLFDDLKLPTQGKTKTGYSTDARVLEQLAPLSEVPRLLLEYRELSKLKGTYVDPLPLLLDSKTGKIHASFHQTVAATGRLSSSDPNLQNIPIRSERGMLIRRAFVPSPGNVLLAVDYSQIELRLLAHMSGDSSLVQSFSQDEDVHRKTAGELFRIPAAQVDDRQRGIAKAINFGLMYGKTAFGLAEELKISRTEAQEIIQRYFETYRGVKEFLDRQIAQARENGFVTTLLGRKRWLPDIRAKNPMIRNNAERMAMNTPLQGTAADLMKLAMIQIDRYLKKTKSHSKMIIQVHDEIVLDCPREEIHEVSGGVTEAMESAMRLSVPLRVNSASADNWMSIS